MAVRASRAFCRVADAQRVTTRVAQGEERCQHVVDKLLQSHLLAVNPIGYLPLGPHVLPDECAGMDARGVYADETVRELGGFKRVICTWKSLSKLVKTFLPSPPARP